MNPLLIESFTGIRVVTLNRPALLNALSLDMLTQLHSLYQSGEQSAEVRVVVLRGTGPKAFCAGGDVRALADRKAAGHSYAEAFFRTEYAVDYLISRLNKPHLALLDGITMGGGVGLSLHGSHRLATEQTVFAMPEVRIGLFPDVGAAYEFARLPDQIGFWLGLTGARLGGIDCYALGLATHYLHSAEVPRLMEVMQKGESLKSALPVGERPELTFEKDRAAIREHFSHASVEAIIASLRKDSSPFAQQCLVDMAQGCPLSQKVTLQHLLRCRTLSLKECFQQDFRLIMRMVVEENFRQGVQALLNKQPPSWHPKDIESVSDADVNAYFEPLQEELIL